MSQSSLPAVWLLVLVVGLAQFAETVYTPCLPEIAASLHTTPPMVEYTLTMYLFGFALGVLFWGQRSDRLGRKPCLLAGFVIFILGCIGCYFATSIAWLMAFRLVQAFGGSAGSVLGQAICRDAFSGPSLGRVYSVMGAAFSIFPAMGPVLGGFISEHLHWSNVFLFAWVYAAIILLCVWYLLPETHPPEKRQPVAIKKAFTQLLTDRNIWGFALIIGGFSGLNFSYFGEGSFYLIDQLGLTPSQYGLSFILTSTAAALGGLFSKRMQGSHAGHRIMQHGIHIVLLTTFCFSLLAILYQTQALFSAHTMIVVTIVSYMGFMFGFCMLVSNALALALVDYKWCMGFAVSLFGFCYYLIISLTTFGMGSFHNGTLLPMPLYFFTISALLWAVDRWLIRLQSA